MHQKSSQGKMQEYSIPTTDELKSGIEGANDVLFGNQEYGVRNMGSGLTFDIHHRLL